MLVVKQSTLVHVHQLWLHGKPDALRRGLDASSRRGTVCFARSKQLQVVFVSTEVAPWSKTGGLGDIAAALPAALAARGHKVMTVAPRYADYPGVFDTGLLAPVEVAAAVLPATPPSAAELPQSRSAPRAQTRPLRTQPREQRHGADTSWTAPKAPRGNDGTASPDGAGLGRTAPAPPSPQSTAAAAEQTPTCPASPVPAGASAAIAKTAVAYTATGAPVSSATGMGGSLSAADEAKAAVSYARLYACQDRGVLRVFVDHPVFREGSASIAELEGVSNDGSGGGGDTPSGRATRSDSHGSASAQEGSDLPLRGHGKLQERGGPPATRAVAAPPPASLAPTSSAVSGDGGLDGRHGDGHGRQSGGDPSSRSQEAGWDSAPSVRGPGHLSDPSLGVYTYAEGLAHADLQARNSVLCQAALAAPVLLWHNMSDMPHELQEYLSDAEAAVAIPHQALPYVLNNGLAQPAIAMDPGGLERLRSAMQLRRRSSGGRPVGPTGTSRLAAAGSGSWGARYGARGLKVETAPAFADAGSPEAILRGTEAAASPVVFVGNDWPSALLPLWLRTYREVLQTAAQRRSALQARLQQLEAVRATRSASESPAAAEDPVKLAEAAAAAALDEGASGANGSADQARVISLSSSASLREGSAPTAASVVVSASGPALASPPIGTRSSSGSPSLWGYEAAAVDRPHVVAADQEREVSRTAAVTATVMLPTAPAPAPQQEVYERAPLDLRDIPGDGDLGGADWIGSQGWADTSMRAGGGDDGAFGGYSWRDDEGGSAGGAAWGGDEGGSAGGAAWGDEGAPWMGSNVPVMLRAEQAAQEALLQQIILTMEQQATGPTDSSATTPGPLSLLADGNRGAALLAGDLAAAAGEDDRSFLEANRDGLKASQSLLADEESELAEKGMRAQVTGSGDGTELGGRLVPATAVNATAADSAAESGEEEDGGDGDAEEEVGARDGRTRGMLRSFQQFVASRLRGAKVVMAVHNMAFQGLFPERTAGRLGLPRFAMDLMRLSGGQGGDKEADAAPAPAPTTAPAESQGQGLEDVAAGERPDALVAAALLDGDGVAPPAAGAEEERTTPASAPPTPTPTPTPAVASEAAPRAAPKEAKVPTADGSVSAASGGSGVVSWLKAAFLASDMLVTVSPGYAQELAGKPSAGSEGADASAAAMIAGPSTQGAASDAAAAEPRPSSTTQQPQSQRPSSAAAAAASTDPDPPPGLPPVGQRELREIMSSRGVLGIRNGLDDSLWDPARDPLLTPDARYGRSDVAAGKARAKAQLQARLGLAVDPDVPLFGFVGRLEDQKGVDVILAAAPGLLGAPPLAADTAALRREAEAAREARAAAWLRRPARVLQLLMSGLVKRRRQPEQGVDMEMDGAAEAVTEAKPKTTQTPTSGPEAQVAALGPPPPALQAGAAPQQAAPALASAPSTAGRLQLALLGSGQQWLQDGIGALARAYPGRATGVVGFDEPLCHLLMAGCDFLLVPSRWEPCGLVALAALRYGTVPLVAPTGGLPGIVAAASGAPEADAAAAAGGSAAPLGFLMDRPVGRADDSIARREAAGSLVRAVRQACTMYGTEEFVRLRDACMAQDVSWDQPAKQWEQLLEELVGVGEDMAGTDRPLA